MRPGSTNLCDPWDSRYCSQTPPPYDAYSLPSCTARKTTARIPPLFRSCYRQRREEGIVVRDRGDADRILGWNP
jgi:hypothetical protein